MNLLDILHILAVWIVGETHILSSLYADNVYAKRRCDSSNSAVCTGKKR